MEYLSHHVQFEMWLALYKFPILLSAVKLKLDLTFLKTSIHSSVFTGHLVYACVAVAFIFRNDNSLIMRRE